MNPYDRGRSQTDLAAGLLMAFPAVLGLLAFVALPFLLSFFLSFTNLRLGSPLPMEFVGIQQYRRIFSDASFQRALMNNGIFVLTIVPLQTVSALGLALLLSSRLKAMPLFRTLFFMPVVFPMSLVAVLWILIYAPGSDGMMNSAIGFVSCGWIGPKDFLHNEALALPAIILLSIWQGVGFQMVVLLAGLQSIPEVLYEAAAIDRAGPWHRFLHVTLPQLRNPLVFTILVTSILAFRVFDQVQIMTRGGPVDATTTVMFESFRTAFTRQQIGQASAMTVIFFIVVLVVTCIQRLLIRQRGEVSRET